LRPGAVNGQRLIAQGLSDESRHDHAVASRLARPDGVEKASHDHRQLFGAVIRKRQKLVHRLGGGIAPTGDFGRAVDALVVFAKRNLRVPAVNLRCGGQEGLLAKFVGQLQNDFRSRDVRVDRFERLVDDQLDANGGSQVDDHIADSCQLEHRLTVQNGIVDEMKAGILEEMLDIFEPAGGEVIDDIDLLAALEIGL